MAALFGYIMDRVVGFETTKAVAGGDFTNEAVLKTAEVLETLISKGYVDPRAAANVYPAGQSNIADGTVAMYLNGTWLPNEVKNQTQASSGARSLCPTSLRAATAPRATTSARSALPSTKDTKYPNAAFALIQWLTSGEWDQKLADDSMGVPWPTTPPGLPLWQTPRPPSITPPSAFPGLWIWRTTPM